MAAGETRIGRVMNVDKENG